MASPVADASRRRREKRRQLDARRSKCRIRLGGHMEQWCLLKERLGTPCAVLASVGSPDALTSDTEVRLELSRTPQVPAELHMTESLESPGSQAQSAPNPTWDEDTAQIGLRRIRKAAKRELMPCDFPGCGRIFSNRQYLNHHKKYQHIHQKSFCCPEPACGKSFNFKKHLKEHVKLHSDTRDYICEFCARSFRTSSNLVIHF